MMDRETVYGHLRALGWNAERSDDRTFRCAHGTAEGALVVFVRTDENWFMASVSPLLETRGNNPFALARWLLRMNRDMHQTKFAYDRLGNVVLMVELPLESLDASEIETALRGLLDHAVQHRRTLREASA